MGVENFKPTVIVFDHVHQRSRSLVGQDHRDCLPAQKVSVRKVIWYRRTDGARARGIIIIVHVRSAVSLNVSPAGLACPAAL